MKTALVALLTIFLAFSASSAASAQASMAAPGAVVSNFAQYDWCGSDGGFPGFAEPLDYATRPIDRLIERMCEVVNCDDLFVEVVEEIEQQEDWSVETLLTHFRERVFEMYYQY